MSEKKIEFAPPIGSPRWSWGNVEWWTALVGVISSGIFLIRPELQPKLAAETLFYRIIFLVIVFLLPYVARFTWFFGVQAILLHKKAIWYDTVFQELDVQREKTTQAQELSLRLHQLTFLNRRFEVEKVQFYENKINILIAKSKNAQKLKIGSKLDVVSTSDGSYLGSFEVREEKSKVFLAVNIDYIEPVWSGYVRQSAKGGNMETAPPPECMALLLNSEAEENDE